MFEKMNNKHVNSKIEMYYNRLVEYNIIIYTISQSRYNTIVKIVL